MYLEECISFIGILVVKDFKPTNHEIGKIGMKMDPKQLLKTKQIGTGLSNRVMCLKIRDKEDPVILDICNMSVYCRFGS